MTLQNVHSRLPSVEVFKQKKNNIFISCIKFENACVCLCACIGFFCGNAEKKLPAVKRLTS